MQKIKINRFFHKSSTQDIFSYFFARLVKKVYISFLFWECMTRFEIFKIIPILPCTTVLMIFYRQWFGLYALNGQIFLSQRSTKTQTSSLIWNKINS